MNGEGRSPLPFTALARAKNNRRLPPLTKAPHVAGLGWVGRKLSPAKKKKKR